MRYCATRRNDSDGYTVTGMFYHGLWNATTDQPVRAIDQGLIGRFGTLDPSDGGQAQRASLSARLFKGMAAGNWRPTPTSSTTN